MERGGGRGVGGESGAEIGLHTHGLLLLLFSSVELYHIVLPWVGR